MIEVRGLTKVFQDKKRGEFRAVDDVSLTVRSGEIYALLGANGAGKTTFLRMLATLLTPTSGQASIAGVDVVQAPAQARARLGFLAASTALYGRMTTRELIAYFGQLHGLSRDVIATRTAAISQQLAMDEFLDRRIEKFSTGMKQKTSIARTIIHDPEVIIFDEPTLGLDVMAARTIISFIRDCKTRGKTVIFSTHVMSEVEKLCDRIGVIHDGKLHAQGTRAELQSTHGGDTMEDTFLNIVDPKEAA